MLSVPTSKNFRFFLISHGESGRTLGRAGRLAVSPFVLEAFERGLVTNKYQRDIRCWG